MVCLEIIPPFWTPPEPVARPWWNLKNQSITKQLWTLSRGVTQLAVKYHWLNLYTITVEFLCRVLLAKHNIIQACQLHLTA